MPRPPYVRFTLCLMTAPRRRSLVPSPRAIAAAIGTTLLASIMFCGCGDGPTGPPPADGPAAPPDFLLAWGGQGLMPGQLLYPQGIAVHDGYVYVVDATQRIQKYDRSG